MANHRSAEKAHKKSLARAARNRSIKSRIKTFTTKLEDAVAGKIAMAEILGHFRSAESEIMKGVTQGVMKLNTASRRVSRLARLVKGIAESGASVISV